MNKETAKKIKNSIDSILESDDKELRRELRYSIIDFIHGYVSAILEHKDKKIE